MIPLHAPDIGSQEAAAMKTCLESGWISSAAPQVNKFEETLRTATGSKHVVAVQSGTAALHLALLVAGIGAGDEVLIPDLTFIATANAIRYTNATPVLIDVEEGSWQMNIELAREYLAQKKGKVKAIILVHVLGYAADAVAWSALADEYGIILIEDAAGAIGTMLHGQQVGTFGQIGTLSFNGNKLVSTGGGGAVLCEDEQMALQIRHLANQAKVPGPGYDHDLVGYNYRMSGLGAVLGLVQLERLSEFLGKHKERYEEYQLLLPDAIFPTILPESSPNHWLTTCRLNNRETLAESLRAASIQTRPFWTPIHLQKPYLDSVFVSKNDFSTQIWQESISLPSGSGLTDREIQTIKGAIREAR